MRIGNFETPGNVFLAPMAGVTDLPFRLICKQFEASLLYTEMINAKAVCYEDKNTFDMLLVEDQEKPVAVQIFGSEPGFMAEAARTLTELNRFEIIDINMGCPAPKVVKAGDGSALMKNPKLAYDIVNKVKAATNLPVTVKFRKGWDEKSINALEFGKLMQEAGADAVTLHGRTREQYYSGTADWEIIKELKEKLTIPVIANGDITSFDAAERILDITKADALMIGRGAQGNPFIFKEVNDYMESAILPKEICPKLKIDTAISHYKLALKYKTQHKAVTEMRKHLGWYLKGLKNSARIKDHINKMYEPSDVINALTEYAQSLT
ncbi:putative TIM-barrel protein, NifR3 family [Acetoanaerobium sticklandii]|uniref:tRNA-dihydrouridine synthase n=1 Tax=Acetoanaerobium sticklandii (strain ATCC 12662 / DSM 519 / JCM 1433 / CCUG 9281 / NCIMB 10654 / HF) TaxID=499177 RepID=E3PXB0_ACESD|nr:tRNA dihydrouridine synthase DusB [Acetoanaerobium sticklandii]CBH21075.1 putative TIM-barrel protein, NifR3 family [Acetoanaerobium sticklandii]